MKRGVLVRKNWKRNSGIILLSVAFLGTALLSGCIGTPSANNTNNAFNATGPVKKFATEYFELYFTELDNWASANIKSEVTGKPVLALVNKGIPIASNLVIIYQELDPGTQKNIENKLQEKESELNIYEDITNVESEIIYKNYRPWARFTYETPNHKWVLMQTYCGQSLVEITFSATREYFNEDIKKVDEILGTFLCKVEIVPNE